MAKTKKRAAARKKATEEKRGLEVAETKPAETIVETTIIDAGFVALLLTRLAWDLAFFGVARFAAVFLRVGFTLAFPGFEIEEPPHEGVVVEERKIA
jgi:ABC-type transporter Mla maintaining outer membrane lipid asymmetry permease subunit MlaE